MEIIRPQWPAPETVRACSTTRIGGVSRRCWSGLNLGDHVHDDPQAVAENRARLSERLGLPSEPQWLSQVHGSEVCLPDRPLDCA
ncbi:MAG: laccase domain-containing protein, partial [Gammaproteobacteria bacterium]|nr:laccase domain-containing protein [Gammaproteobacteria bacterium]